jgi:hypothetical protein
MGAQQSNVANGTVSDVAKNYGRLIDTMMTNQIGFAPTLKEISDVEREWFASFEAYLTDTNSNVSSEDSLYRNIQAFMRLSGDDTKALLDQISDSTLRASADSVLTRTNKAIVLQKYYEYKYLHLSAVFMNFTEFVQKLFELMANASVQVASSQADLTTRDVTELLDAMLKVLPKDDSDNMKRSIQAVHKSSQDRLRVMSQQLEKIIQVSRDNMDEFPVRQLQQQQSEGQVQLRQTVDSVSRPAPFPSKDQNTNRVRTIPNPPSSPLDNTSQVTTPPPPFQRSQYQPSPFQVSSDVNENENSKSDDSDTDSESTTMSGPQETPTMDSTPTGFGFDSPISNANETEDRRNTTEGERKKLPDDAFLFGGGGFLAKASRDINKIVKGGNANVKRYR